jgi:hypothetical protein
MVNYNAALEQVQLLSLEASSWRGKLPFKSSECADSKAVFNLLDFVIPNPGLEKSLKISGNYPPQTQFQFLPDEYKGGFAKDKLVQSIICQAATVGQKLHVCSSEKSRSSIRQISVQIVCSCFDTYQPKTKREFKDGSYAAKGTKKTSVHRSNKARDRPKANKATTSKATDEEE